jgi:DNA-binding response OmpR family regulator
MVAPSKTILVVDDDPFMRDIVTTQLSASGYAVVAAPRGEGVIEIFHHLKPAAIILDFAMPDMSGLEVLERLRREADGGRVPVLMLTAWSSDEAKVSTTRLGAKWLEKPVLGEKLLAEINEAVAGH